MALISLKRLRKTPMGYGSYYRYSPHRNPISTRLYRIEGRWIYPKAHWYRRYFKTILKATLPKFQAKQLHEKNVLLNAISVFVGGKKIEIIKYLIENSDKDNIFYGSYEDIVEQLKVSKPTVVKTFRQLIDTGLLVRLKNKIYKLQPDISTYKDSYKRQNPPMKASKITLA